MLILLSPRRLKTSGGNSDANEGMIFMLQKVHLNFRAIVPKHAESNWTLICLASQKIVMGPAFELAA